MMNNKKILIEALHGNTSNLNSLAKLFEGTNIYDDTNHVDNDFLHLLLEKVSEFQDANMAIMDNFEKMFKVNNSGAKNNSTDNGEKWSVKEILMNCTLEDNIMRLPRVILNKKSYLEAKKYIEEAGGKWNGGKIQGFSFDFNPSRVFNILHSGNRCNLKQAFQYFATPDKLADLLVSYVGEINRDMKILEPSAGTGSIIKAIHRTNRDVIVECFELMPENREILSRLDNVRIIGNDFTTECKDEYDVIVANPPFSNNQDIDHVKLMFEHLKEGGCMSAITGNHWQLATDKKCTDFKQWLVDIGASIYTIDKGEFKDSGTDVSTNIIVINK